MKCLLVRHLPSWLSREEKESLLSHFGAQEVIVMPNRGKMRNCIFAAFGNHKEAQMAMGKLHQLDVFGSRLVVEYARPSHADVIHEAELDKWSCNTCKTDQHEVVKIKEEDKPPLPKQTPPRPPLTPVQRYLYPHPTPSTIANITNAIVCVPKLYVQVLHLMNKMNLPPPFGPPTPTPPLLLEPVARFAQEQEAHVPQSVLSGEESSEIESDEDTGKRQTSRKPHPIASPKRLKMSYKPTAGAMPPSKKRRREENTDEELQPIITQQSKKIEFHVPKDLSLSQLTTEGQDVVTVTYIGGRERQPEEGGPHLSVASRRHTLPLHATAQQRREGAVGTTASMLSGEFSEEGMEQQQNEEEQFISLAELTANKMSETEMKEEHVFKKYSPGEPSVRLYLKNLAKQVEDKDLRYIYGRYVNWSIEEETNMFDVRLMKSGRMKGQAFVGLPSEIVASQALKETNGYLLHGRPMIVSFARSSRPKETGD